MQIGDIYTSRFAFDDKFVYIFLFLGRDEKRFYSLTFGPSGKMYIEDMLLANVVGRDFRILND